MRIKNYLEDNTISLDDKLIGTDHEDADSTKNYTVGDLQLAIRGYKVYTALLTQVGTNPPTATVLENTIGTIGFEYLSIGRYKIISDTLFIENKTFALIGNTTDDYRNASENLFSAKLSFGSANQSTIMIVSDGTNGDMYNTPIEIKIYN